MRTLLIRFSALGDLVLTLPALRDLSASGQSLHFLTLDRFAELLSPLSEIDRVWSLDPSQGITGLRLLAGQLKDEGFGNILDLHDNLRSRTLRIMMAGSRAHWIRTRRDSLRRRLLVSAPALLKAELRNQPYLTVAERHREAAAKLTEGPRAQERVYPVLTDFDSDLEAMGLPREARPLGLAPAAAWSQKAWPRFEEFARALPADLPLLVFGGPGEEDLCHRVAEAAGLRATVFAGGRPLPQVATALARCRGLIGGDSGLAHLAEAVGIPVCTLFGPTVPEFGFAPRRVDSLLIQRDLPCRPCSLHGKRPCKYGDLRCLSGIEPKSVIAELDLGGWLE
jgi:heptosyltransferase II